MNHPTKEECYSILENYGTPPHVIGHCNGVAGVAYRLAKAINEAGGTRSLELCDVVMSRIKEDKDRFRFVQENANADLGTCRDMNLDTVLAAGLLHDMARVEEDHWDVGADWCRDRGLLDEEKIIRVHMHYNFSNDVDYLNEIDLVCLGDRLTLEDHYAGLDDRMDYIIEKAKKFGRPEAEPIILKKKEDTRILLNAIEAKIGITVDELMEDLDYNNIGE
ncbi:MAG: HD domain-containing protein [Bacillota bacterium]|nr:HD domain-containing protein [Bacillota bacterium]